MDTFSINDAFDFGWETFKKRPGLFIGATLCIGILQTLVNEPYQILHAAHATPVAQSVAYLFTYLIDALLYIGLYHFTLKAHDDVTTVSLSDLWYPRYYLSYLGVGILYLLIVVAGIIVLIVPGIIFMLMFAFPFYPVIERGMNPVEALRYSKELTKGNRWQLLLFFLASFGIVIVGLICLLVGVLVALPVTGLANVYVYRTLQRRLEPVMTATTTV